MSYDLLTLPHCAVCSGMVCKRLTYFERTQDRYLSVQLSLLHYHKLFFLSELKSFYSFIHSHKSVCAKHVNWSINRCDSSPLWMCLIIVWKKYMTETLVTTCWFPSRRSKQTRGHQLSLILHRFKNATAPFSRHCFVSVSTKTEWWNYNKSNRKRFMLRSNRPVSVLHSISPRSRKLPAEAIWTSPSKWNASLSSVSAHQVLLPKGFLLFFLYHGVIWLCSWLWLISHRHAW